MKDKAPKLRVLEVICAFCMGNGKWFGSDCGGCGGKGVFWLPVPDRKRKAER